MKSFEREKLLNAEQLLKQVKLHFLWKFYTDYHPNTVVDKVLGWRGDPVQI